MRHGAYNGFKRRPQISAAFLEKKFPYALCNLTFTNKLLVRDKIKIKNL